jgi:hypothetical protein
MPPLGPEVLARIPASYGRDPTLLTDRVLDFGYDKAKTRVLIHTAAGYYMFYYVDSATTSLALADWEIREDAPSGERAGVDITYYIIPGEDFLLQERMYSTSDDECVWGDLALSDLNGRKVSEIPITFLGSPRRIHPARIEVSDELLVFYSSSEGMAARALKIFRKVKVGE